MAWGCYECYETLGRCECGSIPVQRSLADEIVKPDPPTQPKPKKDIVACVTIMTRALTANEQARIARGLCVSCHGGNLEDALPNSEPSRWLRCPKCGCSYVTLASYEG